MRNLVAGIRLPRPLRRWRKWTPDDQALSDAIDTVEVMAQNTDNVVEEVYLRTLRDDLSAYIPDDRG